MITDSTSGVQQRIAAQMSQFVTFNINAVAHLMTRKTNRELAKLGYSLQFEQLPVLFVAHFWGSDLPSQQEIANQLQKDKSGIQRSIRTLERDGYLRVVADSADRRKNLIQLTPAGKLIIQKVMETAELFDQQLTSQLTPEEVQSLLSVLKKISTILDQ
ncbi:MarR family winged helix-turn-helix transcriptional regulator [Spirosoma pollinicola]|uniref:MarR family transcriptional regulator n=1 Tax=Spirosoma pollinicola TaxID=2057025 RepID=A0A2K8Z3Y6_9BACT|nr:MarR family transcriptional regulator [Spirosoma pollinicola]AUD04549.1 MarR family transcriptional regulator [Spirosoma pollinicola]